MEHNMNDSRNELTRERRRNDELTRLLRESREKTIQVHVTRCPKTFAQLFTGWSDTIWHNFVTCFR